MSGVDQAERLAAAATSAKAAEDRSDDALAAREWRRYRLTEDASRDAEDLLTEGIALSVAAASLVEPVHRRASFVGLRCWWAENGSGARVCDGRPGIASNGAATAGS
jgi:negative regulator of sigma E activity